MSSATRTMSDAGRSIIGADAPRVMTRVARLGMSPRQQMLNRYWAHYRCSNYEARRVDWDGRERVDPVSHEAIATAGFIPPGFYDAGATFPLKFRRPSCPYNLVKVIVDRFTGLLFSERHHPQIRVEGDPDTEDFINALAESARLWPAMIQARMFGGGTGSAAIGFQFLEGRPIVEVHDPRWVFPDFKDRATQELRGIEKRYQYPIELFDHERGAWVEVPHWYRRVINESVDILWKPIPVGEGEEPDWENPALVANMVEHDFGFCPVQWIQNLPVVDDIDGDPDCLGIYDMVETIDALLAQANRGIIANCDPTVVIVSPDNLAEVAKGSNNAIKLTQGSAQYMEISGSGPKAAQEYADKLRTYALEVAQCVLEHPEAPGSRTATEIERAYSSMLAKADVLREQYGERGIKPLLEKMLKAAKQVVTPRAEGEAIVRGALLLPDRIEKDAAGQVTRNPRRLGPGGVLKLQWPGYFEAGLSDVNTAVQAATNAKAAQLIDDEHATKFVAEYFNVEDVPAMMQSMEESAAAQQQMFDQQAMGDMTEGVPPEGVPTEAPVEEPYIPEEMPPQTDALKLTSTDLGIIVTVNEARASVGLGPLVDANGNYDPDGDLTIAQFKAKHEATVAAAANAEEGGGDAPPPPAPPKGVP